jgi:hypothetical protein
MFPARLPSILKTCHKAPRLSRNLHVVTTSRSRANAIRRKHATRHISSAAPATRNAHGRRQSAAPATQNAQMRKYCVCHTKRKAPRGRHNPPVQVRIAQCAKHSCAHSTAAPLMLLLWFAGMEQAIATWTVADGCGGKRNV